MKKHEILVDGEKFKLDQIGWDYPQTDSESTGATDDNVMYRDVLPRRMKFIGRFEKPDEIIASKILQMRKKESCLVNFWDLEKRERVERNMYPTSDQVNALQMMDTDEFLCNDIEIRFTQMIPDELM